jgi:hypothetical protein
MVTTTKTTETVDESLVLSVAEAEAQVAAARAEVARLQALVSGEIGSWTTRLEERRVLTKTGRVEVIAEDVPHRASRQVGPLERIQARRALPDTEDQLLLAEEQLALARQAGAGRARAEQAAALEAGLSEVRRELPKLIRELRGIQARVQTFAAKMEALDAPLGRRYFAEAVWVPLLPGEALDFWVTYVMNLGLMTGED